MAKKPKGLFAARKLMERRKKFRYAKKGARNKIQGLQYKYDPLEGAPMASGVVLEKVQIEERKPNSGMRKCVKVQLTKNGKVVTAFVPGYNAIKLINEHDEVTIAFIHGAQKGARGDLPGVKFKVIKVNGVSLKDILRGKREKAGR